MHLQSLNRKHTSLTTNNYYKGRYSFTPKSTKLKTKDFKTDFFRPSKTKP